MRIRDWSSDVCSSDLRVAALRHEAGDHAVKDDAVIEALAGELGDSLDMFGRQIGAQTDDDVAGRQRQGKIGRASCRERVCQYVSISVVALTLTQNRSYGQ